jgi:hypothetical protein
MQTQAHQWFQDLQVERTIKALKRNNFEARYFAKAVEALEEIWKMIPEGATVGFGGSLTLNQIGFFEEAQKRPLKLLNPFAKGLTPEEGDRIRKEIITADVFLASSNAVTEEGELYNIDATGNRVGPMIFGPKKVILVCGTNKIVKDIGEAERRVQEWTAPMNVKRLGYKNPCAQTGECSDCGSAERICNIYTIMAKKPRRTDITILLIGEALGL